MVAVSLKKNFLTKKTYSFFASSPDVVGWSEIGRTSRMMAYFDKPRLRCTGHGFEAWRPHGLVYGQQGIQCLRVRIAGQRHLTQYSRQLTEEDAGTGVTTLHLVHEHWLVRLYIARPQPGQPLNPDHTTSLLVEAIRYPPKPTSKTVLPLANTTSSVAASPGLDARRGWHETERQ